MYEILSDTKSIILGLGALIMSLITYIGRVNLKRLRDLEASAVRRQELEELREALKSDRHEMHQANQDKLNRIDETVTATHRRIDALYRDMVNKR